MEQYSNLISSMDLIAVSIRLWVIYFQYWEFNSSYDICYLNFTPLFKAVERLEKEVVFHFPQWFLICDHIGNVMS